MPELKMIMEKSGRDFVLYACRGEGRGCDRNKYRAALKHCEDCVLADPKETLGDLHDRLSRGDS